nr:hypothetical protein [uncultured Butyrivibrio sp.]
MKVTIRSARMDKDGRHNDRNFDIENAEHIDRERMSLNRYYTYNGNETQTFLELEREYYELHFSDYVNEQNERNTKGGHKQRNRTMDEYFHSKRTRPEDVLLQIGDANDHATGDELWDCAMKYKDKFNELFGDQCVILDMALHMDEATPHVHVRRVWKAEDERGNEFVSQTQCLKNLDMLSPDESKAAGRFNNSKITFTNLEREMFTSICEDEGFVIDRTRGSRVNHLSVEEYKALKSSENAMEKVNDNLDKAIQMALENDFIARKYAKDIEEREKKSMLEKARLSNKIFRDIEAETEVINIENASEFTSFLKEKGLFDEFKERVRDKKSNRDNDKENYDRDVVGFF